MSGYLRFCSRLVAHCLLLLTNLISIPALAQVSQSGRWQTLHYSQHEVHQLAENHYLNWLHEAAELGVLNQDRLMLQQLRGFSHRLILQAANWQAGILDWDWELHLSQQADLDAVCLAGGKLLINPDFIRQLKLGPGETRVLLAHEIAHALAEHHREELSEARELNQAPGDELDLIWERLSSNLGWQVKLSKLNFIQEQEADQLGIQLALESGVEVADIVGFYSKLAEASKLSATAKFRDFHPAATSRLSMALGMGKLWRASHFGLSKPDTLQARQLAQQLGLGDTGSKRLNLGWHIAKK